MWPPLYPLSLSTLYCKKCAKIPQQWWLAANLIQFVVLVQLLTWWWHMMCGGHWWPWSDPGASGNAETWVNCHNEQPDATFYNSIHGTVQCHHQNMNNTVHCSMDSRWFASSRMFDFPMDFEPGNYNVSQLPRQSRHKQQSWLSSCPDSFHRISGSRRISQLITQS